MKKRFMATLPGYRVGAAAPTGHHCPQTGWWLADGDSRPRFISQGDVMPAVDGRPAHWALCTEAYIQRGRGQDA